jgi:hypothetical protein
MTAASTPSPAVETTAADERAEKSATAARSGIRPMARADIPAVERIFCTAFAKQGASDDLGAYIEALFFDNPHYSDENGSIVYEDAKKGVTSAIFSLPIPFEVHGRPVMARLLCAFMSDGTKSGALGAGRITRSLRADQVEFCFTDNASPVSASHWATGGGVALPVESLEWRRAFLPLGAALHDLRGRRGWRLLRLLAAPARLLDRAIVARRAGIRPVAAAGCVTRPAAPQAFLDHSGAMTERFAVRPVWTQAHFDWLLRMVALNDELGPLQCRTVEEAGKVIGVFLFCGRPGGEATVLNLICEEGREFDVTAQMFACLAEEGHVAAIGRAQPFMINAVMRQRQLIFRHRGYLCLNTRHGDLLEAARRGDFYIGGLASESWSRLVTDQ